MPEGTDLAACDLEDHVGAASRAWCRHEGAGVEDERISWSAGIFLIAVRMPIDHDVGSRLKGPGAQGQKPRRVVPMAVGHEDAVGRGCRTWRQRVCVASCMDA